MFLSSRGGTPSRSLQRVVNRLNRGRERGVRLQGDACPTCRKPIEIAERTAAAAEDQRGLDRRRHRFDRLDRSSAGEEDRVYPSRLIGLGPLDHFVEVRDRQRTGCVRR